MDPLAKLANELLKEIGNGTKRKTIFTEQSIEESRWFYCGLGRGRVCRIFDRIGTHITRGEARQRRIQYFITDKGRDWCGLGEDRK